MSDYDLLTNDHLIRILEATPDGTSNDFGIRQAVRNELQRRLSRQEPPGPTMAPIEVPRIQKDEPCESP